MTENGFMVNDTVADSEVNCYWGFFFFFQLFLGVGEENAE